MACEIVVVHDNIVKERDKKYVNVRISEMMVPFVLNYCNYEQFMSLSCHSKKCD